MIKVEIVGTAGGKGEEKLTKELFDKIVAKATKLIDEIINVNE